MSINFWKDKQNVVYNTILFYHKRKYLILGKFFNSLKVRCLLCKKQRIPAYRHTMLWMNLKNLTLSERKRAQEGIYGSIPFIWDIQNRHIYGECKLIARSGCLGEGEIRRDCKRVWGSCLGWSQCSKIDHGDSCSNMWIHLKPLNWTV